MSDPCPRLRLLLCLFFFLTLPFARGAAPEATKVFDIPAGPADAALRQFAAQSGLEVLYATDAMSGIKTNGVAGEMAPLAALDHLLKGTALTVVQGTKSGVLRVARANDPKALRAAPAASDRPTDLHAAAPTSDRSAREGSPTSISPQTMPSPKTTPTFWARLAGLALAAAPLADAQSTATEPLPTEQKTVTLSPFEVTATSTGYYATNTSSGTRLNSKVEDLAASITVITKEQMADFALLDINDIFAYEAGTEGTGTFTDFAIDQNGYQVDNTQLDPQSANRIRGIGAANTTFGNFETSGRVPIDPVDIDGVEISRGPNSSIFGVGNSSGTVNSIPATANLTRDRTQLTFRADSNDGYRTSLDLSRVLKKNVLAARASFVNQHEGYQLKPSGTYSQRLTGMIKYKPFKATTLTASYADYRIHGNRPNTSAPSDGITGWRNSGSPTYDPIAGVTKINGVTVSNGVDARYFNTASLNLGQVYVDRGGINYWGTGRTTSSNDPSNQNQNQRLVGVLADPTGFLVAQPLFPDFPPLTNKAIYDWSSVNIASANRFSESTQTASALLEHVFIENSRQTLAVQLGWFREQGERFTYFPIGSSTGFQNSPQVIQLDVNERLLNGAPNPYFLRPFIGGTAPNRFSLPIDRDTYRAQVAYRIDPTEKTGWRRWLGQHQLAGYGEYKNLAARSFQYRDVIVDNHSWLGAGVARGAAGSAAGGLPAPPNLSNNYFRYYLGDNNGGNIDYGSTAYNYGNYTLNWGNGVTGQFNNEPVQLGAGIANTAGTGNNLTVLKTRGAIIQSHWLQGRVITTFGLRHDERFGRGPAPFRYLPDGINADWAASSGWATTDWVKSKGPTRTAGVVIRPLPWISFHANKSDSFKPADVGLGMHFQVLPDPSGEGKDYGVSLNLLDRKLAVRFNHYKTTAINSRNGASATFGTRMYRLDFSAATSMVFVLQRKATEWAQADAAARGVTLTAAQLNDAVAKTMKLPLEYLTEPAYAVTATDDVIAQGNELEINYTPSAYWTMKLNGTQQESINSNMSKDIADWLGERQAVWRTIIDPQLGRPWFTERYNNGQSASDYLQAQVISGLNLARALEGKSRPQIRKYRFNFSTNYKLAGLTDNPILKAFNIGGALRWEDKGAIGFRGVQRPPDIVLDLDPSRPIYDKARTYVDLLVGYRTRLFANKVATTFQLNVRNVTEGGRLQPIAADPEGRATALRIIEPRLFIASASFEF